MSETTDLLDGAPSDEAAAGNGAAARSRRRGTGLAGMLLPELQRLAGELGIPGTGKMRKSDLVAAISERQVGGSGSNGSDAAPAADAPAPRAESTPGDTTPPTSTPSAVSAPASAAPLEAPVSGGANGGPVVGAPASDSTPDAASEPVADTAPTGRRRRGASRPAGAPTADAAETAAEPAAADDAPVQAGGRETQDPQAEARTEGERPPRNRRERAARDGGERPARDGAERPARDGAERPARDGGERPAREGAERPARDGGERPAREGGERPVRDGADRPAREGGERPARDGADRSARDGGERPVRDGADRDDRGARDDRNRDGSARDGAARDGEERGGRNRNRNANDGARDGRDGARDGRDGARDGRDAGRDGARTDTRTERPDTARADRDARPDEDDDDFDGRGRRGRRYRDRNRRGGNAPGGRERFDSGEPTVSDDDVLLPVAGILDVLDSYAFVRTSGYLTGPNDVYVSLAQVRRYGLRRGDAITGAVRQPREGEKKDKYNALVRLESVNGLDPEQAKDRPEFTKLTPLYPQDRLRLETESHLMTTRIMDLVMPIGKGQRALIVSPPKAGKTMVLQSIANAIAVNNPEVHLMVVLVDERPEEVTDMQRSVKGEVIASTFDRPPADHTTVAELSIERAKRLVEMGHDVVVLLDSITRLGRAYNLAAPASGRILSGGVDSTALYPPKRFLGAARNIENGGSLTIIASALVETGSTMDTVIFEEFKGTGNAELKLDRRLADKRVFPAVDVNASSTRKEEILLSPDELAIVIKLRRVLSALEPQQALELLLDRMRKTRNNIEFLMQVQKTTLGLGEKE
ncbi:transcription termination factor Rho [Modestobacter sp. VKM Ac-2986]|uniref:transcription termination factor Rho n=1 Tax=Modestobacter sp. VKM Ac-2986 TaxID=3004140 RepID=UPI0022AB5574|nr:transcription termination factor Rho [Modestobacter sp. VKM Ac-2986]MCZ2829588.1 transcription termination factor Rho [Modestobacter sp. VKM Ac-2986]